MLLFQFLELIVDDFSQWPTDILLCIFIDQSTYQSVEKVAAFSYGNGIPLQVLTRFVTLANPHWRHIFLATIYPLPHVEGRSRFNTSRPVL